ncbi:MAG: LptF/LptG family permease [Bacteroidota bacterium]
MKKLHRLIISSFAGPFVMTFFIAQFILLMQFLWKYIDDLVGKGLDTMVIVELLFYTSANLVPLALPLAILVSSIMTFGNLSEHFEITAAKASGISLQKLMRPLFVTAFIISMSAFFFSNYILPLTNLKMGSLLYDIRQQKPALSIREGVFYNGIEGYSIKVGDKDRDGKTIRNVMIYDHTRSGGNKKVIVAESGTMTTTADDHFLVVNLNNGASYEEQDKHKEGFNSHPLMRNNFKNYTILFDLSQFKLSRTNEDMFKGGHQMMNLTQLNSSIDSLKIDYSRRLKEISNNMRPYYLFLRDSNFYKGVNAAKAVAIQSPVAGIQRNPLFVNALNSARGLKSYSYSSSEDLDNRQYLVAKYKVEWHRKLTLSAACFILFLIGAPLGAIIRKGGMGLPLVISVLFFLLYHITSITGEKLAKEGEIEPLRGMWFSSAMLLPVGLFLIYKATHDSVIFDTELYKSFFKRFKKKK